MNSSSTVTLSFSNWATLRATIGGAPADQGSTTHHTVGPTNTIAPGTNLVNGATVSPQGTSSIGTAQATTTFLPLSVSEYEVAATLTTDVMGAATVWFSNLAADCGTFFSSPIFGRNDVLLRLQSTETVRGRFVITYARWRAYGLTLSTYWVDVGDDGVLESSNFLQAQPLAPIAFGPGTFDVRLSNYTGYRLVDEHTHFAGNAQLTVRFVPDSRCVAVAVAAACGAISLQPVQNFTLGTDQRVTGLLPPGQGLSAMVYGFHSTNTPAPLPPGCVITNDAFAIRLLQPDASGRAVHSIKTVPLAIRPFSILAQALELDIAQSTLTTSASFRIDCQ